MFKQLALTIPPIRRLWNDRLALIQERDNLINERAALTQRNQMVSQINSLAKDKPRGAADLFNLAYGRAPTDTELATINISDGEPTATDLRALITSLDRQTYPSLITVRFSAQDLALKEFEGIKFWLDRMDRAVSVSVLSHGSYEPHLVAFLREHVRSGMTVVDIGANVGIFTMLAASIGAKVHAFEPNTENCRLILLSKEENGFDDIELHSLALSNEPGVLFFTPHIGSNGGLLPSRSGTLADPNCIVVPAMRLDDMVRGPVHFIKADIEGAEYLALKGGERIISEYKPIITSELIMGAMKRVSGIDGGEFIRWVQSLGYRSFLIGRNGKQDAIEDVGAFVDQWGDATRVEDIAFIPV